MLCSLSLFSYCYHSVPLAWELIASIWWHFCFILLRITVWLLGHGWIHLPKQIGKAWGRIVDSLPLQAAPIWPIYLPNPLLAACLTLQPSLDGPQASSECREVPPGQQSQPLWHHNSSSSRPQLHQAFSPSEASWSVGTMFTYLLVNIRKKAFLRHLFNYARRNKNKNSIKKFLRLLMKGMHVKYPQ